MRRRTSSNRLQDASLSRAPDRTDEGGDPRFCRLGSRYVPVAKYWSRSRERDPEETWKWTELDRLRRFKRWSGLGVPARCVYAPYGAGEPGSRARSGVRGKSGLRETRVAGNARPVRAFGRGSRESATESKPPMAPSGGQARVKGCGKSAPGFRQRRPSWQTPPGARPHRGLAPLAGRSVSLRETRVGRLSLRAIAGPDEWLPPRR